VLDIESGKIQRVHDQPLNGDLTGHCWSPDGRRIAYCWRNRGATDGRYESHLVVADPDGRNQGTIATERGDSAGIITIADVDWR
jgi:Tol biopolymer transport system component